jgi:hypothetical protein
MFDNNLLHKKLAKIILLSYLDVANNTKIYMSLQYGNITTTCIGQKPHQRVHCHLITGKGHIVCARTYLKTYLSRI